MSNNVELSVRGSLQNVINELVKLRDEATAVGDSFSQTGQNVEEGLKNNVKQAETFFGQLGSVSRRMADQMRRDFKSLLSVNALTDSMRLSNQFRGSVAETVKLSDAIRKLGATFGIAGRDFSAFQSKITQGLGDVGLGSDVGVRALEGLSQTPVRGEENLVGYARTAGQLASVGGERGRESEIARSMANVVLARGGDVNDMGQVDALAESLRRVLVQTGQAPSKSLQAMESIFASMPEDLRKTLSSSTLTNLTAAGAVAGPNSIKFLEEYLSKSPVARMAFDAQGGAGIIGEQGIDADKFEKFARGILGRVGGDPRLAAQTLGLSDEAAEGFVRLAENLDRVRDAQQRVIKTSGDLNSQYRQSMGLAESFSANLNRVKSSLATPLSWASQKTTEILSGASESTAGSAAVVGGSVAAAALLAGAGLRGVGKGLGGLGGTLARKEGAEALLGQQTIPVYVVNAGEIGGLGGGLGDAVGGAAGGAAGGWAAKAKALLGKAGLVAGAGAAGYGLGSLIEPYVTRWLVENTSSKNEHGFEGDMLEQLFFNLDRAFGGEKSQAIKQEHNNQLIDEFWRNQNEQKEWAPVINVPPPPKTTEREPRDDQARRESTRPQKVVVELATPLLKASVQPTRGATN